MGRRVLGPNVARKHGDLKLFGLKDPPASPNGLVWGLFFVYHFYIDLLVFPAHRVMLHKLGASP